MSMISCLRQPDRGRVHPGASCVAKAKPGVVPLTAEHDANVHFLLGFVQLEHVQYVWLASDNSRPEPLVRPRDTIVLREDDISCREA